MHKPWFLPYYVYIHDMGAIYKIRVCLYVLRRQGCAQIMDYDGWSSELDDPIKLKKLKNVVFKKEKERLKYEVRKNIRREFFVLYLGMKTLEGKV